MRWRQLLRDPHFHAYAFRCGAASQRAEWRSGSTKNISRCRRLCVLFDWLWHTREQKRRLAVKRTNTFPHIGHSAPESGLWAPSDRSMCSTAAKARVPFFGFCVRLTGSGIQAGQLGLTVPPPTMCPAGENRSRAAPGVMPSAGRQRVGRARQFAGRLRGRSGARLLRQSRQPAGYRDSVQ